MAEPSAHERQRRRHLAEMQLALREGLSLADARMRLAAERWAARDARRQATARCGTQLTQDQIDGEDAGGRFWWQKGSMA
jgi:hypothetical protein